MRRFSRGAAKTAGGEKTQHLVDALSNNCFVDGTEIIDGLYLGTVKFARGSPFKVLNLSKQVLPGAKWLPIDDGDEIPKYKVLEAFEFIRSNMPGVLVCCAQGQSRSACMVIGYLVTLGYSVDEAYRLVESKRFILPHPRTLNSVI